jgi:hypothetical protein
MKRKQVLQGVEWDYREELVASLPGVVDVGVGADAAAQSGLPQVEVGRLFRDAFHDLIDGGANVVHLHCPRGKLRLYAVRRGRHVDIGTRQDFHELGWGVVCDLLDQHSHESP